MSKVQTLSPECQRCMSKVIADNQLLVQQLNTGVHSPADIKQLVMQITNQKLADVEIRLPFHTDYGRNIHIGNHVFINSGAMLTDLGGIYISDDVFIGPNVTLVSVNHEIAPEKRCSLRLQSVKIHRNAWLDANVTVLPGVEVGENAIVAAGAVVSHNVPANTIVAGVPARVIKIIN